MTASREQAKAARDKLGYSEDELATMYLLDWHCPEDRNEAEVIFAEILWGERDHCPLPLMAKDGTVIPVETRVWFGRWSGQDCVFGVCKDLSGHQEAQQRLERIFRRNPSPMALSSILDRRFVDINDAFLENMGYAREAVIGKTSAELGLIPDAKAQSAVAQALRAKGSIANQELRVRRKDGALRDGLFSGEVIHNRRRDCFLTVMVDITERKRMEEKLRESEEHLSATLRPIGGGVIVCDREEKVTSLNRAAETLTGWGAVEAAGRSLE